jgi:hypothetical protein
MPIGEPISSFPKLHAPFERSGPIGEKRLTQEVNSGYEWVFDEATDVLAVEKLDGENVAVEFDESFTPTSIHRRDGARGDPSKNGYDMAEVPLWDEDESHYTEGIANAFGRGWIDYIESPGLAWGELVGPRLQGNRYDLDKHYWVPFAYARERLVYESYGEYPTGYDALRDWFLEQELNPLFYRKMNGGIPFDQAKAESSTEGIIFTHPEPDRITGPRMAKLKPTMFPEYHTEDG